MNSPTIVIFGAGKGTRLGFDLPKPLIEFDGIKLVEYQIEEILRSFPESQIVIIGGYKFKELKQFLNSRYPYLYMHIVENKEYDGSIIKTYDVAIEYMKSHNIPMHDVIRVDGDIFLFKNSMKLMSQKSHTTFFTTACEKETDTVVLEDKFGILTNFKYVNSYIGNAEWACIERYYDNDFHKYWTSELKDKMLKDGGHLYQYLEHIIEKIEPLIKRIFNIHEVDTKEDFEKLNEFKENLSVIYD